jgi:hypothetical protein
MQVLEDRFAISTGGQPMTTPLSPAYVWEISGPCRECDCYIFPHDDDEGWAKARGFALHWLEEVMDQMEVNGPKLSIEVQLRAATESDLEILGEADNEMT